MLEPLAPDCVPPFAATGDFADLSSDELIGGFDEIKGKKIRIDGYVEEFSV